MFYIDSSYESSNRYDLAKFMAFDDGHDVLDSYFFEAVKDLTKAGVYMVQGEGGRPDLLSYGIYETTDFWWILMVFNAFLKPEHIVEGEFVEYPSIDDIEALYFSLKAKSLGTEQ